MTSLLAAALLSAPAPASAAVTHNFLYSFGSFTNPNGIAVDSSGDVYVADIGRNVVEKFDATGQPVNSFAGGTTNQLTGGGAFSFANPAAVAVDNSTTGSDPAKGDIYVIDVENHVIARFAPDGTPANFTAGADAGTNTLTGQGVPGGPFTSPPDLFSGNSLRGLAVDASGNLWVRSSEHSASVPGSEPDLYEFRPSGEYYAGSACETGRYTAPGFALDSLSSIYFVSAGHSALKESSACLPYEGTEVGQGSAAIAFAVDGSDNVYVDNDYIGPPTVRNVTEYDSSGNELTSFGSEQLSITHNNSAEYGEGGIAVSPVPAKEDVYVSNPHDGKVYVFGPSVSLPIVVTGAPASVQPTSATLNGTVNPEGVPLSECFFEWGETASYGHKAPCEHPDAAEVGSGTSPVPVHADLTGLTPDTTYHFRLLAANKYGPGEGADESFFTPGPPAIDAESSSGVSKTAATLEAQIKPDGFDTTYHFEYGTTPSYGHSTPPSASIGSSFSDQSVTEGLTGLQPGTTYRWRVVAVNSAGPPVYGNEQSFTTLPVARFDSVTISNVGPGGASVSAEVNPLGPEGGDTTCHFEYGTDTSYGTSVPCTPEDLGEGSGDVAVTLSLGGLSANTTYHLRVVAHNATGTAYSGDHTFVYDTTGAGLPDNRAYEMVTPAQKNGALIGGGFIMILPDVSEDGSRLVASSIQAFAGAGSDPGSRQYEGEPYAFTRTATGWTTEPLAPPATQFETNTGWEASANSGASLFSAPTPPGGEDDFYVRRPDGTILDIGPVTPPSAGPLSTGYPFPGPIATTADLSHLVYSISNPSLESNHYWPFDATGSGLVSAYEYVGTGNAHPLLVGVGGPNDGPGSTDLISVCGTYVGGKRSGNSYNALSTEGETSTVFFTSSPCTGSGANAHTQVPSYELFARIDQSRTVAISQPSPGDCKTTACTTSPPGNAEFEGASRDGSKVFFTDTQQLTDNASGGGNLYLYENPQEEPLSGHNLVAVSAGDTSGQGPQVQGVMAISPDGSHVYFVAGGVLTAEPNAQGQTASANADNLYLYERDATYPNGRTAFVATLSPFDEEQWREGVGHANVTPDGRFLVFTSHAPLTPDDSSTSGAAQVFRYDAQTAELARISIGERGFNDNGNAGTADASIARLLGGHPGPIRTDPTMSHDGAYVFFQSPVGLTPKALNLVQTGGFNLSGRPYYAQNVYEWEAEGSGGCARAAGCVSLISDGRDASSINGGSSVSLIGADATGANVFFRTADALVPQDTNTELDFYDARIGGGFPYSPPPAPCQADACRGASSQAPQAQTPGSAAFQGPGNPRAVRCRKSFVRRRGRCVKRTHHKRHRGSAHHRTARHNRRAGK